MADLAAAKVAPRQLQLETERLEVWLAETVAIIQIHLMEELAKAPLLVSLANLPVNSMLVGGVAVLPSMEAPLSLLEQEATVGAVKVQDIMTMLLLEPPIPAAEVEVEQEILPPLV